MPTLTSVSLGKFCREVAGGLSPLPVLLHEWGVTPEQFEQIRTSDAYLHEMQVIVREMQELGPDAGYIYRMKALSEEFIADIVAIMRNENTSAATKVDLIKFCAELARLKEKPAPTGAQGPRGPSVVFNFGPGLPVQTIEVKPELEGVVGVELPPTQTQHRGFQLVAGDE